jgi:D-galacturonate reductase
MAPIDVLMVGTGEYTTGYGANSSKTDKAAGVVALTVFDLRSRGLVGAVHLAGVNGTKLPQIRAHMQAAICEQYPGSSFDISCTTYPSDQTVDPLSYRAALAALPRGSAVIVFTPDDTHASIAADAIAAGMHVLVTKPVVKTLAEHLALEHSAGEAGVLVAVEVHKRWDPLYADARDRLAKLGDMSYIVAYMSQPKLQLETFRAWAGISSDISYYLNSHHVDFSEWALAGRARPLRVTGTASTGVAEKVLGRACEDTIVLTVEWENWPSRTRGVGVYTASWSAPKSDVHSQQRFFALAHGGEVTVDQAHRGYSVATDAAGYASPNPLFMRYTPDAHGRFVGQLAYGYRSIEMFVQAAADIKAGKAKAVDFDSSLATLAGTAQGTAILEAGRRSLDAGSAPMDIVYGGEGRELHPIDITPAAFKAA